MLVGRDVLLEAGERALQQALTGRGRLLLLAGEAGIGKTALAGALADRGAACGAVVRTGACWESEGLPAFSPWIDALRRPGGDACALAATELAATELAATDAASARRAVGRRFGDVVDALAAAAGEQPQVVLLEDLHWADESSLRLLAAVAAHLPAMPVLVIATYRDDELPRASPLASIGGNAERLWLGGLDRGAVATVLQELLGRAPTPGEVDLVWHQTAGNPLLITQVTRLLDAGAPVLPGAVRDVLERRLARVSSACDEVLGAAAVLGVELDEVALESLVGGPVAEALDEAAAARLVEPLRDQPGGWRFVHALLQATRYELLGTRQRADLHAAAVHVLHQRPGVSAASVAHHAARGRFDPQDPLPATLLVAAGAEALGRLAWADATSSFDRALSLAPAGAAGEPVRAEAWLGIGSARLRLGADDVRAAFDEAAGAARRLARGDLLARAALGFGVGLGGFEVHLVDHHQIELLEEAAATLAPDDPLMPLVLARLSVALAFVDSPDRRTDLATRAVELARAADDPVVLGHALAAWCDATAGPDAVAERLAAATEIVTLAARAGDVPLELLGRRLRVVALLERNDHAQVDQEIAGYERAAERLGDPLYSWYGRLWRAMQAHARGELATSERFRDEAAALGREGNSVNAAVLVDVQRLMTDLDRRDPAAADPSFDSMLTALPDTMQLYLHVSTAYKDALLGRVEAARRALDAVSDDTLARLPRDSEWTVSIGQLAVAAARLDDARWAATARALLEPVADLGCVEGIGAYLHGSAHRFLGLVCAVVGDAPATRAHVSAATRDARGGGALLEGLAALDGAWALRRAGDPADAARADELAQRAAGAFRSMGLSGLAAEAAQLVTGGDGPGGSAASPDAAAPPRLARQGDTWVWSWEGTSVNVRHAKGVADLAVLLERAGREVHVRELEGVTGAGAAGPASSEPVLDEVALEQYRRRLVDLEDDLDEADRHGDVARAARLAAERDALVDQLTSAIGIGGRVRRIAGDPDERLRKAVSARVRSSIDRIEALAPSLGRHLRSSVRTGFWCAYEPEHPVEWTVRR